MHTTLESVRLGKARVAGATARWRLGWATNKDKSRMGLIDNLVSTVFRKTPPIASAAELADFLDARSAFLAQKCVVEFCRVRAGVYWQKLFSEREFQEKLTAACWQSFPPATAMLAEMLEGAIRPAAGLRQRRLPAAIEEVAASVFARHPLPAGAPDDFWQEARQLVRERLDATQASAPRPVRKVAEPMAKLIHAALPIHKDIVEHDYDYIRNNLRMNLLRAHEDFLKVAGLESLADDLLGKGS